MPDAVLVLNAGSSSLKVSLFELAAGNALRLALHGEVDRIGSAPHFRASDLAGAVLADQDWDAALDFAPLMTAVLDWIEAHLGDDTLIAVGHRVVHGGADHDQPEPVTPALLDILTALTPLAPLHQPYNLAPIRAIAAARPNLPQIACFDTAFHHGMSATATRLALPRAISAAGVRRYGFHGLSYEYIAGRLRALAPDRAAGRVIAAHLGNGASLCAMHDGRSVDTTMGFTALDGLMMGTRCGSIDPGVVLYLLQQRGLSAAAIEDMLYRRSGLLGVSGLSGDMRSLLASDATEAAEAIELFVFRAIREIGALTASLGGLDGLVFTAGIGAHAAPVRARICAGLGWLGVSLDPAANAAGAAVISSATSRVEVRVIETDEEQMIARHTLRLTRPH